MQEYEEVKTSQKNKAYEEKLQEILVMFLQEKTLINTYFFTSAIHICSQKGWLEILKKVIDKNEIDMLDEANGSSALHYAHAVKTMQISLNNFCKKMLLFI